MRRGLSIVLPPLVVALIACMGVFIGGYLQYILSLTFIAMTIGVSLVLVVGLARMITLASGAMMAIGAYGLALLMVHFKVDIVVGMLAAALAGTVAGVVLGVLTARFRGHYLAMVTLVFQFVTIIVLRQWPELTGGPQGMRVPTGSALGIAFDSETKLLLLSAVAAMIAIGLVAIFVYGHFGKGLQAISATEVGSEAFGIDNAAFRAAAFAVSSGVIALAGSMHALQVQLLEPEAYGVLKSVSTLAYPIVGGMTSIWGGLIGGGLLRALPEFLRIVADYQELVYGALVIVIMLVSPDGMVGFFQRVAGKLRPPTPAGSGATTADMVRVDRDPDRLSGGTKVQSLAPALQISQVSKSFGALVAVKDMSLTVPTGTIYGVIGPNGAGKTTLFNMVSGFIAPDHGGIELFGQQLKPLAVRERIAMGVTRTFQNVAIYDKLSCLDNVIIGLGQNGVMGALWKSVEDALGAMPAKERRRRALESLEAVRLGHFAQQLAGSLSLGNQRRLEIARALVSRPKLLMLDEPVSGLDVDERERIGQLLKAINATLGTTMLVIEHNIRFVVDLSRTLSVMHMGSVLAQGEPQKVIKLPEVSRVYFGETERAA